MKQTLKKWLLISLVILMGAITNTSQAQTYPDAQNWSCGLDSAMMSQLASDTGFVGRMTRYNYSMNNPPAGGSPASGAPYIVPVVFHVLSTSATATVLPYAQIKWQMARINAAFRNQMNLFNGQSLGARAVNTQIEFRLACVAQNSVNAWTNSSEPGVMRYASSDPNVLTQGVAPSPSTTGPMLAITHPTAYPTTFPFANYLNIWCVPSLPSTSTGTVNAYGTFPWMSAGIDGIVTRIDIVGNNSYPTNFTMSSYADKGAILAHEMGHYLGLYHTFETMPSLGSSLGCYGTSSVNATSSGDLILDTPPTFVGGDIGSLSSINSCHETNYPYGGSLAADQNDQIENYMSYSDDDRFNTFTQGQTTRMISTFTMTTPGNRFNLNNPTNLVATGVYTNSCSNLSNILTGIFNYSIAAGSNCTTVNVQFTNPTSTGFITAGTTYSWNFGNGTGTGSNPLHAYTTSGGTSYNVSCTATNGTATATYTQAISIVADVDIVGQSGLNMPVCRGSEQTIYLHFSAGAPSLLLTDGTTTVTVNNTMLLNVAHNQAYTFVANASASYSLVPASCYTSSATFNVIDCCSSLVTNGDFESGNTGFYTQLAAQPNSASCYGAYDVVDVNAGASVQFVPNTGKAMGCGGFAGTCSTYSYNLPEGCNTSTNTPIMWQQTLSGLKPNTQYAYSFKMTEGFNNFYNNNMDFCRDLNFSTKIYNSSTNIFQSGTIVPLRNIGVGSNPNGQYSFLAFTYTFTTSPSISPATNFSVEINQINNFAGFYYDYIIDNIYLKQLSPGVQAVGTKTICLGQTAALTTTANCGQSLSNYNVVWTPTVGLSCNTCTNPIASPVVTTVYTLIATPTSTVGSPPSIVSSVTVTVKPVFTVSPPLTYVYATNSATLTATGSTGTYTWNPGALTGNSVVVTPTATTVYTVTNVASGTCTANNTATVYVSAACSQSATAKFSSSSFPSGTYTVANTVYDISGVVTFTGNTSFTGSTLRMGDGAKLVINDNVIVTFNNCKLFSCSRLWYGIEVREDSDYGSGLNITNGTTVEDMYFGIYRNRSGSTTHQSYIKITDSKLNKNYIGVQLLNLSAYTPSGSSYSLTVTNSTITTEQSATSPGSVLKSSTSYTYAYNQITGGAGGTSSTYTNFPRAYIGINASNLSTANSMLIGDSATTGKVNTFSNLDFGIYAANANARVHNNYFYNLKGSTKQVYSDLDNPTPTPIGPDEIGIAVVAQHTVANTYSLQVGTKNSQSVAASLSYPLANAFKVINKAVSAKNCQIAVAKGNYFEGDTTDIIPADVISPTSNTYNYYKNQSAIWVSGLSKGSSINYNTVKNYKTGIYSAFTMSVSSGAYLNISTNYIQSLSAMGYCQQAINMEQVGGANISSNLLEVKANVLSKVYNGINAKNIVGGLYLHDNASLTIDNVKTYGWTSPSAPHYGIYMTGVQYANVYNNTGITSTGTITSSNYDLTNAVFVVVSPNNTITCNSATNVGRGFYFQGNCTSPNGWLGNGISNSYRGLELKTSGVIGSQGTAPSGTLAANTWSNVTQETYVSGTTNANTASYMIVGANTTYTTAPSLNYGTASQTYSVGALFGIRINTGTDYSCPGSGGGGFEMMSASSSSSGTSSTTNDGMYASLVSATSSVYPDYADEMVFANQQLVYQLQKQGIVTKNVSNPTLQSFYSSNTGSNIGKFSDVQDAVANNNNALALSKNNSITPTNVIQQKTKRAYELMLKLNSNCNYQYSSLELKDLTSMANECAVKGWYVTEARNILNVLRGYLTDYADNCENTKSTSRIINTEDDATNLIEKERSFVLFPNPNNGNMVLTYDLGDDDKAEMNLFDVTGKLINNYTLSTHIGTLNINDALLQNGIYFYRILVKGKIINTNKIVIIK